MPQSPKNDPVLKRFRTELDKLYGDRIERVVLFGSRARGDAHEDSDYDVAVFLKNLSNQWDEVEKISDVETDIMRDTGQFVHTIPFKEGAYNERTLFMHEMRKDGVDI